MLGILLAALMLPVSLFAQSTDPYLWLEDIKDSKSLNWVQQQNAVTTQALSTTPRFQDLKNTYIELLNKKDFLRVWRDEDEVFYLKVDSAHPRGQVMKVARKDFSGEKSPWTLLLDVDDLSKKEGTSYVFRSFSRLPNTQKALAFLSVQGRDEVVVREFDLAKAEFVKDGFAIPQSKTMAYWLDQDTLLIGYNEGPDSITHSSYPRRVRYWKRGVALKDAALIKEFPVDTVSASVHTLRSNGKLYGIVGNTQENGDEATYAFDEASKKLVQWPLHPRAEVMFIFKDKVFVRLTEAWTINNKTYAADSVLAFLKAELDAGALQLVTEVFRPNGKMFPQEIFKSKNKVLMTALFNAQPQLLEMVPDQEPWSLRKIVIEKGSNYERAWADEDREDVWFTAEGYAMPKRLVEMNMTTEKRTTLQEQKVKFSLKDIEVKNYWAASKDGTKVPYTTVALRQAKKTSRPTLQYGYGGFRISETPFFSEGFYRSWILRGGVFVSTQIRGGLEFGEEWHQQAIRENKQNVFNDFIAISEDLIQKKITTPDQLAIQGGSNGGLLVSAVAVQRPDLYKAVVCQVPLTDMLRFDKLLAGSSWVDEYGDPDVPADRVFLEKYSPYQNVKAGVKMPTILFMTSTNDDRVHPGHARKMAAKMMDQGHAPLFYEETEGGHGGSATVDVRAFNQALVPEFLSQLLNLQTLVPAY